MLDDKNLHHRKGTVRLQLVYADGLPAGRRSVSIEQKQHKFLFACGAFETLKIVNPTDENEKEFYTERMSKWLEIFNCATLPFYWGRFEPERGTPQTEQLHAAAHWLQARHVVLKGHPLCWLPIQPLGLLIWSQRRY